jgi:outer membrane protein TolC
VTEGYWRLYAAHLQVQAVNAVLPLAQESVRVESLRMNADRSIPADVARAQVQLDGFRRSESTVLGQMRKRSLQLRQLMGGDPQIVPLLLPSERPLELPPPEDPAEFIQLALQKRPLLNQMRERASEKQILWGVAKNRVLPSLDLRGEYWVNRLSNRLDDSFYQVGSGSYSDWTVGFTVDVPIGNKTARGQRQIAELAIAREQLMLCATEKQVSFEIAQLVSDLQAVWQRIEITKRQAKETQEWLRVSRIRYTQPPASNSSQDWLLLALTDLQSAMRAYVDAIGNVGDAIPDYSTWLAQLQQAQGISVYEWQQTDVASEHLPVGGHAGLAFESYRSDPQPVMRCLQGATPTRSDAYKERCLLEIQDRTTRCMSRNLVHRFVILL